MDFDEIAGFDWDDGNWPKCAKHGLTRDEIEAMFFNAPGIFSHPRHSKDEQRLRAIGPNDKGRMLYVSFTLRTGPEGLLIRPITARYMHKKEIRRYGRDQA